MARGGTRVGAGRPPKDKPDADAAPRGLDPDGNPLPPGTEDPLAYMLRVMNDPAVDEGRRDRIAVAAAPYCHAKVGEAGKKATKEDAARDVAKGRFAPAQGPRLAVDNTGTKGG